MPVAAVVSGDILAARFMVMRFYQSVLVASTGKIGGSELFLPITPGTQGELPIVFPETAHSNVKRPAAYTCRARRSRQSPRLMAGAPNPETDP